MAFATGKLVTRRPLRDSITLIKNSQTLAAETFKVPLNFDFQTKLCFEILEVLINTTDEFFESTQIDTIIDFLFASKRMELVLFNLLYAAQAALVTVYNFYDDIEALNIALTCVAGALILIEII